MGRTLRTRSGILFLSSVAALWAQQPQPAAQVPVGPNPAQAQLLNSIRPDYVLGSNDQIQIGAPQAEEINARPFRVDPEGFITLPIVGRIRASGLTVQALEAEITTKLREYIREPQVIVTVVQFRSEPVFVVGAFRAPGIYPLQGRRTLIELMTSAGGLNPNASRRIKVTRRADYGPIPLSSAVVNTEKKISTIEISLESLTENINPEEDLVLQSYDVISADRAEKVYVAGEVTRVSGIELAERGTISITQAITEAGGLTQFATRDQARVLRPVLGTNRRAEIPIDLKRVFEGKDIDFPLLPNDVLYVPRSGARSAMAPLATGVVTALPYVLVTPFLR